MVDARFFPNHGPFTLASLAALTGATLAGNAEGERLLRDVAPLDRAGPDDVSFLDNSKYIDSFIHSNAGACFIRPKFAANAPSAMALLISDEPYHCYAKAAQKFYPDPSFVAQISPQAHIDPSAKIGAETRVESGAVIGANVTIGAYCVIGPNAVIDAGVTIGDNCRIGACSSISHALIGNRVVIHRGVHIGQDGFGYAMGREGHIKVPQLGRVIIEDEVEIGSGTTIDRGSGPDTFIGFGSKIDNLVQIGHNVQIGKLSVIIAQTGIAGSSRIGDGVILAGQVGVSGHIKIGSGARIAAKSGIIQDVPPGASYGGYPAVSSKDWHRQTVALSRLIKKRSTHE